MIRSISIILGIFFAAAASATSIKRIEQMLLAASSIQNLSAAQESQLAKMVTTSFSECITNDLMVTIEEIRLADQTVKANIASEAIETLLISKGVPKSRIFKGPLSVSDFRARSASTHATQGIEGAHILVEFVCTPKD